MCHWPPLTIRPILPPKNQNPPGALAHLSCSLGSCSASEPWRLSCRLLITEDNHTIRCPSALDMRVIAPLDSDGLPDHLLIHLRVLQTPLCVGFRGMSSQGPQNINVRLRY